MPAPLNLTGAWVNYAQMAIYYIRHLNDNSIWWAGFHSDGFHPGVIFTNVFRGVVNLANHTIEGSWADVPRGLNLGHGRLGLDIVEEGIPDNFPPPSDRFGRPLPRPDRIISLRFKPESTTGGFGDGVWTRWFSMYPQDINDLMHRVRRTDNTLDAEHPPYKDFGVVFGHIGDSGANLNWTPIDRDYCSFITGKGNGQCGGDDCDGDLTFRLDLSAEERQALDCQRGFWKDGWAPWVFPLPGQHVDVLHPDGDILAILNKFGSFEAEGGMFGRENLGFDCHAEPRVLLPGWMEHGGNSILVNGLPINENAFRESGVTVRLFTPEIAGGQYPVTLRPGARVRVTGVITIDPGHRFNPWYNSLPEIHPFYAIDVLQNFQQPRLPGTDLTGVWHADDVGTYYLHQVDGNTLWWLGMSRDQGRAFANVFHGTINGNTISGEWTDVPIGEGGARSGGQLTLVGGDGSGQLATVLTAIGKTGGFSGSTWKKLYDRPLPPPDRLG